MAVFSAKTGSWTVVDWKTDRVDGDVASVLTERYARQIGAYVEALSAMTDRPARGTLYATRTGEWIELPTVG